MADRAHFTRILDSMRFPFKTRIYQVNNEEEPKMKRTICIAALAAFALCLALPGQVITVTSPTAVDDWCIGTTYSVTWTKSGAMPNRVTVRLRRAGSDNSEPAVEVIANETDNNGTCRWPIPASVAAGEYFIRVKTVGSPAGTSEVSGDSPNFTIMACAGPEPSPARIIVSEPDAGEEWCLGGTYTIRWRITGRSAASVDIRLRRAGSTTGDEAAAAIATSILVRLDIPQALQVLGALRAANVLLPAGRINEGGSETLVEAGSFLRSLSSPKERPQPQKGSTTGSAVCLYQHGFFPSK